MRAIAVFMLLVLPLPAFADGKAESPADGTEAFRAGLECFREARYEEAAGHFEIAYGKLSVVGDYVLLYMSRALMESGDIAGPLRYAGKILAKYPVSPLRREARAIEARLHAKDERDGAVRLLESYAEDYPSDGKMRLLLGELLKKQGRSEKAEAVLKALYIEAGQWAEDAYNLLGEDIGLSREELVARAENLMENGSHQKAEGVLRTLLALDNYKPDKDIRKNLAFSLYRQKKYSEAAPLFLRADDLYLAAKSYLRAGNKDRFFKTLDAIITRKDAQGAELLVALAEELRRDGDFENALSVLENAMKNFPSLAEGYTRGLQEGRGSLLKAPCRVRVEQIPLLEGQGD
jgi:tetratricopeptide (TPR) repeat protein